MLLGCVFQLRENVRKLEERLGVSKNLVEHKVRLHSKTCHLLTDGMTRRIS